jgi:hypothetical protein
MSKVFAMRVSDTLRNRLEEEARVKGVRPTELARRYIDQGLQAPEKVEASNEQH